MFDYWEGDIHWGGSLYSGLKEMETTDSSTKAAANEGLTHNPPLSPHKPAAVVMQASANGNRPDLHIPDSGSA